MHKQASLITVLLAVIGGCAADPPTATPAATIQTAVVPPRITGSLHTSGRDFVDANNNPLRLLGVDLSPIPSGAMGVATNISSWHFNFVRVVVYWEDFETTPPALVVGSSPPQFTHTWDTTTLTQIKAEVDALTQSGVAVVLDMHQVQWSSALSSHGRGLPPWLYPDSTLKIGQAKCDFFSDVPQQQGGIPPQEAFRAAWRRLLSDYTSYPRVIGTDILNEPTGDRSTCSDSSFAPDQFYIKAGQAIRNVDPNVLLLIEDNAYESYLNTMGDPNKGFFLNDSFATEMANAELTNWAYSWHFYPNPYQDDSLALNALAAHVKRATNWSVPLWIGEFNPKEGSATGGDATANQNWMTDLPAMMSDFKADDLSWSLWEYEAPGLFGLVNTSTGQVDPTLLAGLQAGF